MLPRADIDLRGGVIFQDQPTLTWIADPVTRRIRGRGDGWEAIRQAVEIIVSVERFKWQIYTPNLGTEPGYAASELQRRLEDAFLPDSRILGIKDFRWTFSGVSLTASFTVPTVFGDVPAEMEVPLA